MGAKHDTLGEKTRKNQCKGQTEEEEFSRRYYK
jgi:hypothetical protein